MKSGVIDDVCDGKIWSEFQCYNGQPCLSQAMNLTLMMNFDFFQPYKQTTCSVGAIYCVVMNLPWTMGKNAILIGLIAGRYEEQCNINTFLEPLFDELIGFWEGYELNVHSNAPKKVLHCMLLCLQGGKHVGFWVTQEFQVQ